MRNVRINFQKFINKCAIVDHGLPHFFRAGFPALPSQCELSRRAVVLNDHGMIYGQVGRTSLEVLERIATCRHHLRDELVGLADGALRVVDKAGLNATPFARKGVRLVVRERVQLEVADALGALSQKGLRTLLTDSRDGSFVLRSKAFAQIDPLAPAGECPDRKHDQHHHHTNPDNHEGL